MALLRDTKARARRIDLAYFRKPSPFRRWKRILSILVPGVALAWIAVMAATGDERIYNSGKLSTRHAMFETKCEACHASPLGERYLNPEAWQTKLDQACLACHDGPAHHQMAATGVGVHGAKASKCSSCHLEHKGATPLAQVRDPHCVACHAAIPSFDGGHPEFAPIAKKTPDPSALAFNHAVHLHPDTAAKKDLMSKLLQPLSTRGGVAGGALGCAYCHAPVAEGASMGPVHYETHCRDCHPIKLKDERAPHVAPSALRDFLRSRMAKDGAGGDALAEKVAEAEIPIYTSDPDGCMKCHKTDLGDKFPEAPPTVAATGLRQGPPEQAGKPRQWFTHARFDHGSHRELRCTECHAAAEGSTRTSDLLMPGLAGCASCHSAKGGVSFACVTCHDFHDPRGWAIEGRLKVKALFK